MGFSLLLGLFVNFQEFCGDLGVGGGTVEKVLESETTEYKYRERSEPCQCQPTSPGGGEEGLRKK